MSTLTDAMVLGSMDDRVIAAMRLMLALLALLSTYIDPSETTHYVVATYAVLALYLVYSIVLCTLAVRRRPSIPATKSACPARRTIRSECEWWANWFLLCSNFIV